MKVTAEEIANMTVEEYEKRRPELLRALQAGEIAPPVEQAQNSEEDKWLRELRARIANMSPEEYEKERGSILLELNQRRHNPHRFRTEDSE